MSRELNQEDEFGSKQEASFQIRSFQQNSSFDQKPSENEASRKKSHSSLFQDFLNDSQPIKTDLNKKEDFENHHGGSFQQPCSVAPDEQLSINQSIQINPLRVNPDDHAPLRQQEQQQELRDEAVVQECYIENPNYQNQTQYYEIANPQPQGPQQSYVEAAPPHPQTILEFQPKKQPTQLPKLKHVPIKQNTLFQEQNHNQNNNPGLEAALAQQPQPQKPVYFQQHYDYFPVAQAQFHNYPAQTNYVSNGYSQNAVHPGSEAVEDERDRTRPSKSHQNDKKHGEHSSASETDSQHNKGAKKKGNVNVVYVGQAQPIGYNPGVHLAAEVSVYCCFGLLNSKDTCCHWICDLLIFFIAAPARLLVFLCRGLWNCCLEQLFAALCDGCQRDCANCGNLLTGSCSRCWASIRKGVTGECLLLCTCCASCTGDQIARKAQGWCSNCEGCLVGCWSAMVLFISGLCNKICSYITDCCRMMIALMGKCLECLSGSCKWIYEIMAQCCQIFCELCSKCL